MTNGIRSREAGLTDRGPWGPGIAAIREAHLLPAGPGWALGSMLGQTTDPRWSSKRTRLSLAPSQANRICLWERAHISFSNAPWPILPGGRDWGPLGQWGVCEAPMLRPELNECPVLTTQECSFLGCAAPSQLSYITATRLSIQNNTEPIVNIPSANPHSFATS